MLNAINYYGHNMKSIIAILLAGISINLAASPAPVPADDPRLQPAAVTFLNPSEDGGFPEIYIDGYIHQPTVEAFKRVGNLNGAGLGMVYFNSLGGDLVAAIELGQLIRERGFSTRVGRRGSAGTPQPGRCESGCPFAFAGGRFRFLDEDSKMGVHRFYRAAGQQANDLSLAQVASTLIATHLSAMGVSLSLMDRMVSAGSESMRYLTPKEAYDLGLINAGELPARWGFEEVQGAIVLVGTQEKVEGTGKIALACGQDDSVELAALFKSWYSPSLLRKMDTITLTVDGAPTGQALAELSPELRNGFLTFTTEPSSEQLIAISRARTVGFRYVKSGTDLRAGFDVEVDGASSMIGSFIQLCQGKRPRLAARL
ncbi:hypothetical protein [Pseudomonas aeruginosa]|uniref:COG3904 family protein n=1 Tax=Pseudomonas aeruginosa TaxID=287 RepID=UPI0007097948|nr:hypothetical protein [Pseudomonas aeruginosa]RQH30584.1 hypothetical protein IPC106_29820 [Pseudomonas aeruginosa]HCR1674369.1 hypothetical protein [Pseudomonas aeruginosa]